MKVYNWATARTAKAIETQAKHEQLVYDAIVKLGGKIHMRVMEFRKHITEPLRETHIKEALRRLADKGLIEVIGERHDSRGYAYRIIKAKEAV